MELPQSIEAILFSQAEPVTIKRLSALLKRSEEEVREGIKQLGDMLSSRGIRLLENGGAVMLGTAPDASALIEAITKEELSKELSKASVETLAIVLYKGPITRSEIDYIRGVNSTFILRNLLIRGLVEKIENPKDQRSFLYKPTFQLLQSMGVTRIEELPQYNETVATLLQFVSEKGAEDVKEQAQIPQEAGEKTEGDTLDNEADIAEEDEAGTNFDDKELREHHEEVI